MIGLSGDSESKFKTWVRALFFLLIGVLSFEFLKCSVTFFPSWCLNVDVCVCLCFRPWWTSAVGLPVKTKAPAFRIKRSRGVCVRLGGRALTATCPVSPVRWRPPTEVSSAPSEAQGSVREVLTDQQHCRARAVIVGGEGRADGNEWASLWRRGLKMEGEGRGASLEIPKRNVFDTEGRLVPLQHWLLFLTYLFLVEG